MFCETECFAGAMTAVFGADFDAARAAALLASPDVRTAEFADSSHQTRLHGATDVTSEIHRAACRLFDEAWDGVTPLRQLGVQVTELSDGSYCQFDLFSPVEPEKYERQLQLDRAVDGLRDKYGENVVRRARFVGSEMEHMAGGLSKERRTGITKKV